MAHRWYQHLCATNHNHNPKGGMIMAMPILNNNLNKIYAECLENLIKAEALIDFALLNDISEMPICVIFDYLWGLSDFIKQAKKSHENLGDYF